MSSYTIKYSNELYHHGILGQRWGTRNGPPYPLDASDHSASEKKAGWRKSLGSAVKTVLRSEPRIEENPKRNLPQNAKSGPKWKDPNSNPDPIGKLEKAANAPFRLKDVKNGLSRLKDVKNGLSDEKLAASKERDARKQGLKEVDPNLAKNKQTRRVAYDYHNLSDEAFKRKYKSSKKTFEKRYVKTDGDTYSKGVKGAVIGAIIMANSSDVNYYDFKSQQWKTIKMGKEAAIKTLAADIGYSEAVTRLGYNKAESAYNEKKEFEEWKKNRG